MLEAISNFGILLLLLLTGMGPASPCCVNSAASR